MQKPFEIDLYTSPEVQVVEIKGKQILCQSTENGSVGTMDNTDGNWE